MTIVVCVKNGNDLVLASDSLSTVGGQVAQNGTVKIFLPLNQGARAAASSAGSSLYGDDPIADVFINGFLEFSSLAPGKFDHLKFVEDIRTLIETTLNNLKVSAQYLRRYGSGNTFLVAAFSEKDKGFYVYRVERVSSNKTCEPAVALSSPEDKTCIAVIGDLEPNEIKSLESLFAQEVTSDDFNAADFARSCVQKFIDNPAKSKIGGTVTVHQL